MRRKAFPLLLSLFLLLGLASANAAPIERDIDPGQKLTYDDHIVGHLSYPAVERAENFLARQEKLAARPSPAAAEYEGDYGHKGCTAPEEHEVGDEKQFWVSQSQAGNVQIDAVLAAKSPHGYLWVQREFYMPVPGEAPEGGFVTQGEAEAALVDWEKIYDIDRQYFGKEPRPDTPAVNLAPGLPSDWRDADCDEHISILNFPIDAPGANGGLGYIAGYYSSEHEYPNGEGEHASPFSNETEMFFMNSAFLNVGDDTYAGVLAHEFFHMIQFSNDYNEETWVNEGMADIAAVVNGFGDIVQGHIDAYSEQPDNHLFDWGSEVDDYGQAVLFFDYLFNHYGEADDPDTEEFESYLAMANLLTKTPKDGAAGVTRVINSRPDSVVNKLNPYYAKGNFKKVFKDYLVANYLDAPDLAKGQFGYANRDVAVAGAGGEDQSAEDATVHPYAGEYYEFGGDQEGQMEMSVADPVAVIPAKEGQPKPEGGFFAWSSRGDELITWLERPANLTDAAAPILKFRYWHQIEEDWDYAYVRVSDDGGKTYDFQNTAECGGKNTDPNGNNRAVLESGGITGNSDGWQTCELSLEQYAGKKVLVRFEYDTDQAVTEPGYVVDNVKMKDGKDSIWAKAKFEKKRQTRRWDFGGSGLIEWRRLKPLKANRPFVQVVRVSGDRVFRKLYKRKAFERSDGKLVLKRPATVSGDRTIAIFTSTTPIATDPFTYSYNIVR